MTQAITLQQYTGAALLNARQLNLSLQLITGEQKPTTLSHHNIMELLNVIESLAMSSHVLFDGSIQQQDKERLIRNNRLYHNLLQPTLLATPEERLACCEHAATQSWLLIEQWLAAPQEWSSERAIPAADAAQFVQALQDGLAIESSKLRQYASDVAENLNFLGAKSVAGVLLAAPDEAARASLRRAVTQVAQNATMSGCFAAGIVNRFRVNFVNELAASHDAAYVAAPVIEGLKTQQNMLLWRYLGTKLQGEAQQQHAEKLRALSEQESAALNSFPYAYALLMNKRVKKPSQLLDLVFKVRDESVIRMQATEAGNRKRYIHNFSEQEFLDTQRTLFEDTYIGLSTAQDSWRDTLLSVGRSCLPAVLSVGSAGLGMVIPDSVVESAAAVSMASAGLLAERSRAASPGSAVQRVKLYRDNYMRWQKLLDHAAARASGGVSLQGRVADLFGVSVV